MQVVHLGRKAPAKCPLKRKSRTMARRGGRMAPTSTIVSSRKQQGIPLEKRFEIPPPVMSSAEHEYIPYDGNTALVMYLREASQTKLLTPKDEIELAARIKKGDAKAREIMIKANLRLVVKIAREYEGCGMPLLDLINEGNIGLMKAVEHFDPAKGAKLSTYGSWWIKQSIKRALANQSKTIRLPVHVVDKLFKIRKTASTLGDILGREPSDEEIAQEMGYTAERIRKLRVAAVHPASLDMSIGEGSDTALGDVIEDEQAESPSEIHVDDDTRNMLSRMLDRLDPREKEILQLRFGMTGEPQETLEAVGARFGITRERIRQVQNAALKKLRKFIEKLEKPRLV